MMDGMSTKTRTRPHRHQHMRDIVPAMMPYPVRLEAGKPSFDGYKLVVTDYCAGMPGLFKWTRRR